MENTQNTINLTVTQQEFDYLLGLVAKQPLEQVYNFFNNLHAQRQSQTNCQQVVPARTRVDVDGQIEQIENES